MRVFISWSGPTSRRVAEALRDWLPDVIQNVQPWMSASDIDAGVRWSSEIGKYLEGSDFGIICLTPDNLVAPWILFESGALSKKLENSHVTPYLFRVSQSDVEGPLAQFQQVTADKEGTKRLINSIFIASNEAPISAEKLDRAFDRWWPTLEESLTSIPAGGKKKAEPKRSENELLDEILLTVRGLQRTVINLEQEAERDRILRRREKFMLMREGRTVEPEKLRAEDESRKIEEYRRIRARVAEEAARRHRAEGEERTDPDIES